MLNKTSVVAANVRRRTTRHMTAQVAAAASLGLAALATGGAGQAKAQQYPWCAVVNAGDSLSRNCSYSSYEQCWLTAEAQQGFCYRNERYPARPRGRSRPRSR